MADGKGTIDNGEATGQDVLGSYDSTTMNST